MEQQILERVQEKQKARTYVPLLRKRLQGEPYQTYLRWLFGA